ncbi:hypothetical protein [Hydrogenophaga sp.]|uniref:hypothetical protein n=1 Tax=Hydrogenophaga sp. TaxID=1904254 RepID=UPI003F6A9858
MTKFLNHDFKKVCSEPRNRGLDTLIQKSIVENRKKLASLVSDGKHLWIKDVVDVNALMFALDQLHAYYGGASVSDEHWALAGYYAYQHLDFLDTELEKDEPQ